MTRPIQRLDPTRTGREAEQFAASLEEKIVGQDEAIRQIVEVYQTFLARMSPSGRPLGNFLFLGPTGTGKTRLVEAVAESLMGDARAVIKIDCAEFQHSHEIAKLIGSPPGYLGHRETHPLLSQEALDRCHTENLKLSFVLFDEIEKASDALWNLLLGILDKATLTLGDNRKVDFSRAIIFMTSNLGAGEMASILRPGLGFAASELERRRQAGVLDEGLADKISRAGLEAARRKFTPEFLNRIDKTVVFKPLGDVELRKILDLELSLLKQRLLDSTQTAPSAFTVTEAAKDFLLREGTDARYGARHLKRAIERALVHPICNLIATEQVRPGDRIQVDFDPGCRSVAFYKEEEAPVPAMAEAPDTALATSAGAVLAAAGVEAHRPAHARSTRRS